MSLATNVTDLATRVATEIKAVRTLVNGNAAGLSGLNTTAKSNLVAALNELQASIAGASGIDDATTSTTTSWSSSKTDAEIDAAIDALVNAAPGTLNTLNELAAALGDDPNFATSITNQIAGKADATHTHAIGDVTGLQGALDGKSATGHTHATSDVTGLDTALAGKSNTGHGHTIADVSGLQSALDAKANSTDVGDTTSNFVTTFEAGLV